MNLPRRAVWAISAVAGVATVAGAVAAGRAREERRAPASSSTEARASVRPTLPSSVDATAPLAATPRVVTGTLNVARASGSVADKRIQTTRGRPARIWERLREGLEEATRGEKLEEEGPRGPGSSFDAWFYGQRTFPARRIPKKARLRALRSALKKNAGPPRLPADAQGDLPLPYWAPLGPSTIRDGQTDTGAGAALSSVSGRLQAIAVDPTDPDVVYAGGAQGGVWKTTNATSGTPTWMPLTDREASLATGAIAIDPKDHLVIYVGTGEAALSCDSYYGAGILKSTDGGATWTLLGGEDDGPFRNYAVSKIVVDPTSNTVWATTTLGFYSSGTAQCATAPTGGDGGLWRSEDGGTTWTLQDVPAGGAGSAQMHDMVLDPDDLTGNTLYVAVEAFQIAGDGGIWKSTNAKGSPALFTKLATGFADTAAASPGINRITLDIGGAGSGPTLYAALSSDAGNLWGVYKSTSGGATWTHLDGGQGGTANVTGGSRFLDRVSGPSFTILMVGRRVIVGGRFSRTVSSVQSGDRLTLSSSLTGSTLSGTGWSVATYPNYCDGQCWYDMTVGVDPQDADVVYVGGNGQRFNDDKATVGPSCAPSIVCPEHSLWRSDDGGLTWSGVSQGDGTTGGLHVDDHAIAFDASIAPSPSRVYDGNDGGIWRSEDKGGSWTSMNTDIAITQFQSLGLHPSDPTIVLGGTQDNGTNLLNAALEAPPAWFHADYGDGGQAIIDQSDPQRMLHTYFNLSYYYMGPAKSSAGGAGGPGSWDLVGSYYGYGSDYYNGMDPTEPVSFYAPLTQHPAYSPNVVYFGSSRLYRSPDPQPPDPGVESWTAVSPELTKNPGCDPLLVVECPYLSAIGVHPRLIALQEVIYTGSSDGRIAVSKNINPTTTAATAVWTTIDTPTLPGRFVTDIEVAESDPTGNTAYVTFSGFNVNTLSAPGHVFKTTNGLSASPTWTALTGDLPDVPANAVALVPTAAGDRVLVGTDIGVFSSDDGGTHWKYLNDGHPVVAVFALDRSRTTGQIVSSTHGRGMFELRERPPTGPPDNTAPVCGGTFDGGDPSKFDGNATDNVGIAGVEFLPGASPHLSLGSIRYSGAASVTYVATNDQVGCAFGGAVQVTDGAGYFCREAITFAGNPIPEKPVAQNDGPVNAGQPLHLDASTVPGATYAWTGPNGFSSADQNPIIDPTTTSASGTYEVTVTVGGCVSEKASTTAVVRSLQSDFDGNGTTDLLWQNQSSGDLFVWYMNGTVQTGGGFTSPKGVTGPGWFLRGAADLNSDGSVDLLWQNVATGALYVWFMNGRTFVSGGYLSPSRVANPAWAIRGLADFNRDGAPDILWRNSATGDLYVWVMDGITLGSAFFLTPSRVPGPWDIRGLADLDADGFADIVWHNSTTGGVYVWFMDGLRQKAARFVSPSPVGLSWRIARVADFNGDHHPDLLWRNQVDGQNYVWFMDGTIRTDAAFLSPAAVGTSWIVVPR